MKITKQYGKEHELKFKLEVERQPRGEYNVKRYKLIPNLRIDNQKIEDLACCPRTLFSGTYEDARTYIDNMVIGL